MNFYEILKTKKLGRGSPDYWTQLFSEHVGGTGEWKVAGVLPLTFTAKAGNAVDWVIEGNDLPGTENLFDKNNVEIGAYDSQAGEKMDAPALKRTANPIAVDGGTVYRISNADGSIRVFEYQNDGTYIGAFLLNTTFTTSANTGKINLHGLSMYFTETMMLVKGSTAPDHFIPYQQGVGERTENLFDGTIVQGVWNSLTGQVPTIVSSSKRLATSTMLAVDATETYNIKVFSATSDVLAVAIKSLNSAKEQISDTGWAGVSTSISGADYIVVNIRKVSGSDITPADATGITITKGSTAPTTYIPYGYQIPLTTTSGADSKTVDIYIGDSPLTEGETVSKTSTGIDIELFEGENTVSTTLYNKPTMEIKYIKRR